MQYFYIFTPLFFVPNDFKSGAPMVLLSRRIDALT